MTILGKRLEDKATLKLGIIVFSVFYGIAALLIDVQYFGQVLSALAWLFLFGFFTYLLLQAKHMSISLKVCLRFLVVALAGTAIIWFRPWAGIANLGAYAANLAGSFLILFLMFLVAAMVISAVIYCVMAFTFGRAVKLDALIIIRFILVASLSAIIISVVGIISLALYQAASHGFYGIISFFDGMLSQLAFGITYYYVVKLFLDEAASADTEPQA